MLDWKIFAIGAAFFAGLTAVLAKIGVKNVPSNLATFIRTIVVVIFCRGFIAFIFGREIRYLSMGRYQLDTGRGFYHYFEINNVLKI